MAQAKVTREEFDKLTPIRQGGVVYMQGGVNDEIPNSNPYEKGTKEYAEFDKGYNKTAEENKGIES